MGWLQVIGVILLAGAALVVTEILIQINWLGRHSWPFGRLWVNLILLTLVASAITLAYFTWFWVVNTTGYLLSALFIFTYLYFAQAAYHKFFAPLFAQPGISWRTSQQQAYFLAAGLVTVLVGIWGIPRLPDWLIEEDTEETP